SFSATRATSLTCLCAISSRCSAARGAEFGTLQSLSLADRFGRVKPGASRPRAALRRHRSRARNHPQAGAHDDRDQAYRAAVTRRLRTTGIRDKPIARGSPWQNSILLSSNPEAGWPFRLTLKQYIGLFGL